MVGQRTESEAEKQTEREGYDGSSGIPGGCRALMPSKGSRRGEKRLCGERALVLLVVGQHERTQTNRVKQRVATNATCLEVVVVVVKSERRHG